MKNSINYLKFDFKIAKGSIKYYVLIQSILCFMFIFWGDYDFGISYLFFFLIILGTIPFSFQGNEKSNQMYYMFPTKISSMVLGRFLYLIVISFTIFLAGGIILLVLYLLNKIQGLGIATICLNGIVSLIICLIQYPIFYKLELEKGKILSVVIYLVSALIVFLLPRGNEYLNRKFHLNNNVGLMFFSLGITLIIGCVSYLISCRICRRKEI